MFVIVFETSMNNKQENITQTPNSMMSLTGILAIIVRAQSLTATLTSHLQIAVVICRCRIMLPNDKNSDVTVILLNLMELKRVKFWTMNKEAL